MENKQQIISILTSTNRPGIENLITYLEQTDFFTAPASTKFHGSYDGGLAEHSLHVWYILTEKNKYYSLELSPDTIALTALLHDLCKINFYIKDTKNVLKGKKDNGYGKMVNDWQEELVWVCKDQFPIGHGEKSVITALKFIQLTDLEIAMIRWHMGGYEPKESYRDMTNAVDMYKPIVALQTSDMEASHLIPMEVHDNG